MTEPTFNSTSNSSYTNGNLTIIYVNDDLERFVSMSVFILFSLIGIAGLVGNGLVTFVVAANPLVKRNTTNTLILNLAAADLLFVIFCVPFTATDYIFNSWPFGDLWCRFVQYIIVVSCHASVYTLVLMSLDRYLAVCRPVTSISIRTTRNAIIAITVAWFVITSTAIPVGFSHGEASFPDPYDDSAVMVRCTFLEHEGYNHSAFQISFFLSSYVLPLAMISVLYLLMLGALWKERAPGGKASAESRRGKKRVTRMIVAVVITFAICWLPIHIVLVLKSVHHYDPTLNMVALQIFSHVLAYSNSCVNPILYAFLSENFRKAFRKVIHCGYQHNSQTHIITKTTRTGNGCNTDIL